MAKINTRQEFFIALFGKAEGLFEVRVFGTSGGPQQIFFDSLEKLCRYDYPNDKSVYFGCAPRATRGGKKENVSKVTAIWGDIDFGAEGHKQTPVYMSADEARAAIREKMPSHLQPCIIVETGGGLHCYWILVEPEPVDTPEKRERVESIMRRVAAVLGGDAVHDISRVMRVPYTNNVKIPGQPRRCRVVHFEPEQRFDLSSFETLPNIAPRGVQACINEKQPEPGQFDFNTLPDMVRGIIMTGVATDYDNDRSRRDFAVIKALMRHGATDTDIKAIFAKYAVGDKAREQNGRAYLRHTISKVRAELEPPEQGDNGKAALNPGIEADRVLADNKLKFVPEDSFYLYGAGYWRRVNETYLLGIIDNYLGQKAKKAHRSEILEKLRVHNDVLLPPGAEMNSRKEMINLENGMLELKDGKLLEHSPDYLSTIRLPISYDSGAVCPGWDKFLPEVLTDEKQRAALQEFFGYALTMDCQYEKAAILYGESGCNGKSVTLQILEALLGGDNCAHEPWALMTEPFHLIRLRGRLLNVSAETPPNEATDTSIFKLLVTGEPVSDSQKHRDRIDFRPFAKLAFACNTLPRILDSSEAFFRRVLLFNYPHTFKGREDRGLAGRLKQELPGILNWALEGLWRLRANNHFTKSADSLDMLEQFRRQNNPVRTFVAEQCRAGNTLEVEKSALYRAYKAFCETSGFRVVNKVHFFRELYRCAGVSEFRRKDGGKAVPCIIGIEILEDSDNGGE